MNGLYIYAMNEPLLTLNQPPMQSIPSMPSSQMNAIAMPNEFLMPVPFCELVCDHMCWALCECGICFCCIA